jgi:hypothetical protein
VTDAEFTVKLTPFLANEVCDLIVEDREQGHPAWGWMEWESGKRPGRRGAVLHIMDVDTALSRVKFIQHLYWQNSQADGRAYVSALRSLTGLVNQVAELANSPRLEDSR